MSDIDIIRGNNYPPARWQFLEFVNPDIFFPLEGSVFKLTIATEPQTMLSSDVDAALTVDLPTSTLAWNYTVEDFRALPLGQSTRYEIERWIDGTQQTLVRGALRVTDGMNPD